MSNIGCGCSLFFLLIIISIALSAWSILGFDLWSSLVIATMGGCVIYAVLTSLSVALFMVVVLLTSSKDLDS